ncbi:hypothetical protein GCM10017673_14550 [Streptosporangium violaceochromogenes]|nr:hypothetical protein GCM10017673_14550 [Streptosporangium violaceochromogenes]
MFSPDTLTALKAQVAVFERTARDWAANAERARKETAHCEKQAAMYGARAAEYQALAAFAESQQPQRQPVEGDVLVAGTPAPAPEPASTGGWCRCGDDTRPGGHAFTACDPRIQPRVRGPFEAATPQAPDTPETSR